MNKEELDKTNKIFYIGHCDDCYYLAELSKGIKIDNMKRSDLLALAWTSFKRWIEGE